jgi:para-nitrobenzyl esterase
LPRRGTGSTRPAAPGGRSTAGGDLARARGTAARPGPPALLACVLALVTSCSSPPAPLAKPVAEQVRVEQGVLIGRADDDVLRYQGVPYAAPPVGDQRWRSPRPPQEWPGALAVTSPGPRCPQVADPMPPVAAAATTAVAEDCLTLDVTVAAGTTAADGLPVLVWLHGGRFSSGAGSDHDPRRLVTGGPIVVVTVNYRLGALGFLGLRGLAGSGTFGLQDQQAALTWVQRNIARFGGDPARVTIGGSGAGADSVCAQLASPGSVGLFARAILHSGGCHAANPGDVVRPGTGGAGNTWKPRPLVDALGAAWAAEQGCAGENAAADAVLDCLRALPVEPLVTGENPRWSPATATATLPRRPSDLIVDSDLRAVPTLMGTTRDEGTRLTASSFDLADGPVTEERFAAMLALATGMRGERTAAAQSAYPLAGRSAGRVWADLVTDRAFACPNLVTYRSFAQRRDLYVYEFADPAARPPAALPGHLRDGVTHGAELPYLFDVGPDGPAPDQAALAAEMIGYWTRFVAGGDPNEPGRITWPRFVGEGEILTLAGGEGGITPRSAAAFAADHHCDLWGDLR